MTHTSSYLGVVLCLIVFQFTGSVLGSEELTARLLREGRANWKKLREFTCRLEGTSTTKRVTKKSNGKETVITAHRFDFRSNGRCVYKKKIPFERSEAHVDAPLGSEFVTGLNSQYTFQVKRSPDSASYELVGIGGPYPSNLPYWTFYSNGPTSPLFESWRRAYYLFELIYAENGFAIEKIEHITEPRPRIRVDYSFRPEPGASARISPYGVGRLPNNRGDELLKISDGTILLDPDNHWRVLEYTETRNQGRKHTNVEYGDTLSGFPIAKRSVRTSADGDSTYTVTNVLESVSICDAPDSELMLSAFGLPEPGVAPERSTTISAWLLYILLGLGLLITGLGTRWLVRRWRTEESS